MYHPSGFHWSRSFKTLINLPGSTVNNFPVKRLTLVKQAASTSKSEKTPSCTYNPLLPMLFTDTSKVLCRE